MNADVLANTDQKMFRNVQSLVLASLSPRRKDLLQSVGLSFEIVPSQIDETMDGEREPCHLVRKWAFEKAAAVAEIRPDSWVLGADTVVTLEGKVFGKPSGSEEAACMLRELSGRTHEVISAVCLMHFSLALSKTRTVATMVTFKDLSNREIHSYVSTGECLDKAGAYGIQGQGAFLVKSIQGSYTNVVGLPLCETVEWLMEERIIMPAAGNGQWAMGNRQ